ncbi:hypothetical protein K402DRAFT_443182 [Aulographum hederae CBS 113979]|uniref:Mitochondrial K+-H+ exchange-related-domain-containing protein n=1 Tax=Aulographum hederae CBS 113979 TaxID=1176131 RepID=A0A6G1HHB7_9PEZI|nr:hypothetical protein K402DRAFT_443182 [Aulographum hederae CBS 113979]
MRLFLLPISTRRSLIYCERRSVLSPPPPPGAPPPSFFRRQIDSVPSRINKTWAEWERAEKGWQKKLTVYANQLFKRIPYEEWGLKSIPALTAKRKEELEKLANGSANAGGKGKGVEVVFPGRFMEKEKVLGTLETLATERQGLHRSRLYWSVAIAPLTAPFTIVPVIPNIPFFYVAYRGWSHWKALRGSQHLQLICKLQSQVPTSSKTAPAILTLEPSSTLDSLYAAGLIHPTREKSREGPEPSIEEVDAVAQGYGGKPEGVKEEGPLYAKKSKEVKVEGSVNGEEKMLLKRWNGKVLAERFEMPELEIEIERAVEQVEKHIAEEGKKKEVEKKDDAEGKGKKD